MAIDRFPSSHILYGGDYNPDQWLDRPDILIKDIELMRQASINTVTLGVFAWAALEPLEGEFHLDWLQKTIAKLYQAGICTILATPSGARPRWLAERYPEVLRVDENRVRCLYGERHNHCYTSPVYRGKVAAINTRLAETFKDDPAVIMWHISNEYGGECHCDLCQDAFRRWVKDKYVDVGALNSAWWTPFWSHQYQSFDQVESPSPRGDTGLLGLNLDWKRFVTEQTADFMRKEIAALRNAGAQQPTTTNFMEDYLGLNYYVLGQDVDFISWDSYPRWHCGSDETAACKTAMQHDLMRSIRRKPFLLMESSPASVNWHEISRLKRPGVVETAALQAVGHGADAAMFFQMRQGRGGYEKFHGAVIDHYGGEDTRVFREVSETGRTLASLASVVQSEVKAPAAIVCDTESRWAMEAAAGPRNAGLPYKDMVLNCYRGLKRAALNVDVLNPQQSLDRYQLVVVPMLYMFQHGIEERLRAFVHSGGTLVLTCWSGIVNETDLCFEGGTPHGLMDVVGVRSTEIDALPDGVTNTMVAGPEVPFGHGRNYVWGNLGDIIELRGAKTLCTYGADFCAGMPALTENTFGAGTAYYVAADAEPVLYEDLFQYIVQFKDISRIVPHVPAGVYVTSRQYANREYVFASSFAQEDVRMELPDHARVLHGDSSGLLHPYQTVVWEQTLHHT